jgi:hypothetical protein
LAALLSVIVICLDRVASQPDALRRTAGLVNPTTFHLRFRRIP